MRSPFLSLLVVVVGCSSAEFSVAVGVGASDVGTGDGTASDTGGAGSDTGGGRSDTGNGSSDTGSGSSDTGSTSISDTGSGTTDAIAVDTGPPCEAKVPELTCSPPSSPDPYVPYHDLAGSGALTTRLTHSSSHSVSFVLTKAGRIEKIGFRLSRYDSGGGSDGDVTVSAAIIVCKEILIPLAKHVKKSADVPYDTTFYFNPSVAPGVPYLPYLPVGARLVFTIETTSTRYSWDLRAAPMPSPNPMSFMWSTKTGTGPWSGPSTSQVPATYTYIRNCY